MSALLGSGFMPYSFSLPVRVRAVGWIGLGYLGCGSSASSVDAFVGGLCTLRFEGDYV